MNSFINFNGQILPSDTAVLTADNRGFRYGDGLFETMKVVDGRIQLESYHFERLLTGARLLQFPSSPLLAREKLVEQIGSLCQRNDHQRLARVRLVIFRGNGGLYDPVDQPPDFIIQSWALVSPINNPGEGLAIDIFPDGRKSCDLFANLKSNNYLIYNMAALYARQHQLNDCLVLNSYGRIADSSIANLFYCRQGRIYTPPLTEGCVAGVMRRFLIKTVLPKAGYIVQEKATTREDLEGADEIFLTNALKGISWVRSLGTATYGCVLSTSIKSLL